MKKIYLKVFIVSLALFALSSCAAQKKLTPFKPYDLNPMLQEGKYIQKVDNFIIVLDASGSMSDKYKGSKKVDIAKNIVGKINKTIPDIKLNGALRVIGQTYGPFGNQSKLIYGLTRHTQEGLDQALQTVTFASGGTPLGASIDAPAGSAVSNDLKSAKGNIAALVVSDGIERDRAAIEAAKNVKKQFGDRLCIYPILVGSSLQGKKLMEEIGKIGECGFTVNADDISSSEDVAGYVEKVFLVKVKEKKMLDQDGDGVSDNLDRCPDTPEGVKVNSSGCPLDSDGDGVYDYLDKCPGTPRGVAVNNSGCPLDSDGDGVYDYQDKCPETPRGVAVNSSGCPLDSDGDGVYDYLDKCPGTPRGAPVDSRGCPLDTDGDGVFDYLDKCENTPRDLKVDTDGCPIPLKKAATIALDIQFDTDKADIKPRYYNRLKEVADFMTTYPGTKAVIEGHTDSVGSAAYNQKLSQRRAESVRDYLIRNFNISPNRLTAKGFGEERPVASNKTEEGRRKNRRIQAVISAETETFQKR